MHKPPEKKEEKDESSSSSSSSEDEGEKKEEPKVEEKKEKPKCPNCQKELPFHFGRHGHRHGFKGHRHWGGKKEKKEE